MRPFALALLGICSALAPSGCARKEPAPDGEAVIVVDTNLPVPAVVSRLRIDVYTVGGTWIATRDDVRPDTRDWPVSFSLFNDDPTREAVALVRLRAYPEGRLVRYTGIVFAPLSDLLRAMPTGNDQPRFVEAGVDRTPGLEPDPTVTVDRVVRVRLAYGVRGRVQVSLHGACAGHMASLVSWSDVRSCIDGTDLLAAVPESPIEPTLDHDLPTQAGTWGREPCTLGSDATAGRVCVPGGAFLFGDAFYRTSQTLASGASSDPRPERVLRISRFAIDRDEVSVARYRDALSRGFVPASPVGVYEKDGAPGSDPSYACTFSAAPRAREDYPLSCVPWDTAHALCLFEGGNLPTEGQWEYLALAAGNRAKTTWPWGEDLPSCNRAVYARSFFYQDCLSLGAGVQPLRAAGSVDPAADAHPLGVRNLVGSLQEHTLDTLLAFDDPCWTHAPAADPLCMLAPIAGCPDAQDPGCLQDPSSIHGLRGGSWYSGPHDLRAVSRTEGARQDRQDVRMGVRCAYPAP